MNFVTCRLLKYLTNYVTDPIKSIISSKLQGTQPRQIQSRIGEAILHKMRIVESLVPIHFTKCDMVQNVKYRLPLERHDKNARDKHKQKTTLGIIQSKEGGGKVRNQSISILILLKLIGITLVANA